MHHGKAVKHPRKPPQTAQRTRKRRGRGKQPLDPYPNKPLRRLYLQRVAAGKTSIYEVAVAMSNGKKLDTSHVERMLGLRAPAASVKKGVRYESPMRTHVERWQAAALLKGMGVDPVEFEPGPGWPLI